MTQSLKTFGSLDPHETAQCKKAAQFAFEAIPCKYKKKQPTRQKNQQNQPAPSCTGTQGISLKFRCSYGCIWRHSEKETCLSVDTPIRSLKLLPVTTAACFRWLTTRFARRLCVSLLLLFSLFHLYLLLLFTVMLCIFCLSWSPFSLFLFFSGGEFLGCRGKPVRYGKPAGTRLRWTIHSMAVLHVHWFDVPSAKASCFFPMNVNQITVWHYNSPSWTKSHGRKRGTGRAVGRRLHVHSTVKYKTPEKALIHLNHLRSLKYLKSLKSIKALKSLKSPKNRLKHLNHLNHLKII